ncbi:MAG: PQQ-binding-like beta-propeller repeat protein [Pikeienuella sp.]
MSTEAKLVRHPGAPEIRSGRSCLAALLAMVVGLGGCGLFDDEERLEGARLPVRGALAETGGQQVIERALPPAVPVSAWTQTGANAAHNGGHIAGPTGLSLIWRADAGTGASSDGLITSAPVSDGNRVYTLDAAAEIRAFDAATGSVIWTANLVPNEEEDGEEGFGGGLALDGDRLVATTGFGEVLALSAASGEVLWRRAFGAPFRAGPAVAAGRVLAVTRASQGFALDLTDGTVLWRVQGVGADASYLGGASPALGGGAAVVPFASGELVLLDALGGRQVWNAVITGGRRGLARSAITDLTGDPVLIGPLVVSANQSGRTAALDARTGRRVWTRRIGATAPIWAAGDSLWMVSDTADLLRLDARTGQTLWERALPAFEDEEDREDPITYSGPVLISGRIMVTDSLGQIWSFDAVTGAGDVAAELSGGSLTGAIVSGDRLFVLDDDATLHAFR